MSVPIITKILFNILYKRYIGGNSKIAINDKTRKLLWGRSGSQCAFCRSELIMDATPQDNESVIGEECHIISGKPNGPRYNPEFRIDEIDSYSNLILLCRIHHKIIDDQPETFTTDILRKLKANHERHVKETLKLASSHESLSITKSIEAKFLKVKSLMPELIAEIKKDLSREGKYLIRELFIMSNNQVLNPENPCFVYYFEEHENLQGKMHILEHYRFVIDMTSTNVKKYRLTEEFVELLLAS